MKKLEFINFSETTPVLNTYEIKKICGHLNLKFATFLQDEFFELETGCFGTQIQLKLTLTRKDETFVYPVEAIYVQEDEEDLVESSDAALLMLEYLILYFEEFLSEERNVYLPLDWSVHHMDDMTFFVRGFVRNLKIEKLTDQFLTEHGHGEHAIKPISSCH